MYVRDHNRPVMHRALGFDPTEYDLQVFRITSAISRQVFPFTLRVEDPRFLDGLERLRAAMGELDELRGKPGLRAVGRRLALQVRAGIVFAQLYFVPVERNEIPQNVRMAPAW